MRLTPGTSNFADSYLITEITAPQPFKFTHSVAESGSTLYGFNMPFGSKTRFIMPMYLIISCDFVWPR